MEEFHRGNALLIDEDYSKAVDAYSTALLSVPQLAPVFANRAAAYLKLRKFAHALQDCNQAIALDASLEPAYYRKGQACFELEEYESAKRMFEAGLALVNESNIEATSKYRRAIRKCDAETEFNNRDSAPAPAPASAPVSAAVSASVPESATAKKPAAPPLQQQPATRYEYYQSNEALTISVLAKGLTAQEADVMITSNRLRVVINRGGISETVIDKNLYANIDEAKSRFEIRKTKMEIVLVKTEPSIWPTLDGNAKSSAPPPPATAMAGTAEAKPVPRPYASKKDWNAVEGKVILLG
jgi:suppressor of G2 allele of SKP1